MSVIHPLPPDTPRVSLHPVKIAAFALIAVGALVIGRLSSTPSTLEPYNLITTTPSPSSTILGEKTQTVESYLPTEVRYAASMAAHLRSDSVSPDILLGVGRDLAATAASELTKQTEKAVSGASHTVTNFIYKNTIERIIDNLIQSLPQDRQKHYQADLSPTPSPKPKS